ncbi:fructose-bisphosphatase class II [Spiroplasma melliferum]|uniref:fructose-bisphosphatase n=2 Tax=Spiroplasma melliferum TaxID=2134 RepID=A0AAI9T3N8_SPIME|nr:fructose-bisphosphatase class II [Spiroplasma melliferum]ELL44872.1 fructose 1,6-bisphosphatase II [Spiroplasma melliferum IPMB4A]KAI92729.1 fructose 1,6-bisphosphatase [Spiroplasma melliferum KC3]QCO24342.1 fructose 1,6-bisphosphatase II [Spiroplasma melliferum]
METNSLLFLRAVQLAVIASYELVGKNDKNMLDQKAVDIINKILTSNDVKAKIAIGEGELDAAPMLYQGQTFSHQQAITIDIAVDSIEGTIPASKNEPGSISCIAIAKNNTMLQIPEMYMEKLFLSQNLAVTVDFNQPIEAILLALLKIKQNLSCIILNKPRHQKIIKTMRQLGIKVELINEGDVLGAIDVVLKKADFLYGIGGAPEGVLMSALAIATNYKMFARLIRYEQIWPNEKETALRMKIEQQGLEQKKISYNTIFSEQDLVADKQAMFFAASLTGGTVLKPLQIVDKEYVVHSFIGYNNIYHQIISKYPIIDNVEELLKQYSK